MNTFGNRKESAVPSSFPKNNTPIYYWTVEISRTSHLFLEFYFMFIKTCPFFSPWRVPLELKLPVTSHIPHSYFITETLIKTQFSPINKYVWCYIEVLCNIHRTMESDSGINYYENWKQWACLWMLSGGCNVDAQCESRLSDKDCE